MLRGGECQHFLFHCLQGYHYRVSISADQTVLCGSCNNEFSTSNDPTDTFPRVCPWGQLAVSHNEGENLT